MNIHEPGSRTASMPRLPPLPSTRIRIFKTSLKLFFIRFLITGGRGHICSARSPPNTPTEIPAGLFLPCFVSFQEFRELGTGV